MSQNQTLYGLHSVAALLKSAPQRILQLYCLQGRSDQRVQKLLKLAEAQGLSVQPMARNKLDQLSDGEQHQGLVAVCRPGPQYDENYLFDRLAQLDKPAFLLILDGVTDPHNLGACLRSAEAAGVDMVIIPKDKSAGLSPVARKVACGAAEILPLIPVTNLARSLKRLRQEGIWLVGAAGEADSSLYQADLSGPLGLVMGAEGEGLRRLTRETCDFLVKIPMAGQVASLNVSVATGICLFEALRQRSS